MSAWHYWVLIVFTWKKANIPCLGIICVLFHRGLEVIHSNPGKVSDKGCLRSKPLKYHIVYSWKFSSNAANPVMFLYSIHTLTVQNTLGELEGEAEHRKNRKAKQQGVLSTYDRKGRKHPITLAHTNESPEKCKPIYCKMILMLLIKT